MTLCWFLDDFLHGAAIIFPKIGQNQKWKENSIKKPFVTPIFWCSIFDFWIVCHQIFHNLYFREVEKVLNWLLNEEWKIPKLLEGKLETVQTFNFEKRHMYVFKY